MMETEAFDFLDAPMERISGAEVPMPYSWAIEGQAVPQIENIINGVLQATFRSRK